MGTASGSAVGGAGRDGGGGTGVQKDYTKNYSSSNVVGGAGRTGGGGTGTQKDYTANYSAGGLVGGAGREGGGGTGVQQNYTANYSAGNVGGGDNTRAIVISPASSTVSGIGTGFRGPVSTWGSAPSIVPGSALAQQSAATLSGGLLGAANAFRSGATDLSGALGAISPYSGYYDINRLGFFDNPANATKSYLNANPNSAALGQIDTTLGDLKTAVDSGLITDPQTVNDVNSAIESGYDPRTSISLLGFQKDPTGFTDAGLRSSLLDQALNQPDVQQASAPTTEEIQRDTYNQGVTDQRLNDAIDTAMSNVGEYPAYTGGAVDTSAAAEAATQDLTRMGLSDMSLLGMGNLYGETPSAQESNLTPRQQFYNQAYNAVYNAAFDKGMPNPEVIADLGATQAALETQYGTRMVGNNYFGIKGSSSKGSVTAPTKEFVNGQWVTVRDPFRTYGGLQDSASDYVDFINKYKRYSPVVNAETIQDAIAAQGRSGYATDPRYGNKLSRVFDIAGFGSQSSAAPIQVSGAMQPLQVSSPIPPQQVEAYSEPVAQVPAQPSQQADASLLGPEYTADLRQSLADRNDFRLGSIADMAYQFGALPKTRDVMGYAPTFTDVAASPFGPRATEDMGILSPNIPIPVPAPRGDLPSSQIPIPVEKPAVPNSFLTDSELRTLGAKSNEEVYSKMQSTGPTDIVPPGFTDAKARKQQKSKGPTVVQTTNFVGGTIPAKVRSGRTIVGQARLSDGSTAYLDSKGNVIKPNGKVVTRVKR